MVNVSDLKSVGPNTAVPVRFRPRAPSEYSNRDFSNHFIEVVFLLPIHFVFQYSSQIDGCE